MDEHNKKILSDIRKNNIFGERQDYIIKQFLTNGGDAVFYSPIDTNIMFGRTTSQLYVILLKSLEQPDVIPTLTTEETAKLTTIADAMGGRAIYGINKIYCKSVKWFAIDGKKLTSL